MDPTPTMEDVARAAGVHQTTVSRALRNDRRLPESTRRRIQELADKMGYRPNPLLSALGANLRKRHAGGFRAMLALVVPTGGDGVGHQDEHAGAMHGAHGQGFELEEIQVGQSGVNPERLGETLESHNILGLIVGGLGPAQLGTGVRWDDLCSVTVTQPSDGLPTDRVGHDHYAGMREIIARCLQNGYRRPWVVLSDSMHNASNGQYVAAYWLEQKSAGMLDAVDPWITATLDDERFKAGLRDLRPDVIITNDFLLDAILACLGETGTRIPEELAVVSVDTLPMRGVSGIQRDAAMIGEIAVQLVIDKINRGDRGMAAHPRTVLVQGRWLERGSLPKRESTS